jgi:hypothetical protein
MITYMSAKHLTIACPPIYMGDVVDVGDRMVFGAHAPSRPEQANFFQPV